MSTGGNSSYARTPDGMFAGINRRLTTLERRLPTGGSSGGGSYQVQAGIVSPFGGGSIPSGWLLCDGTAVLRSAFPELFAAIGTTWGAGDGLSTFNLPNLKGRFVAGRDPAQVEFDTLGETGGLKTTLLADINLPSNFVVDANTANNDTTFGLKFSNVAAYTANSLAQLGKGGVAINNLPPYAVANWIISTGAGVGGGGSNVPALPAPITRFGPDSLSLSGGGGVWGDVAGATYTFNLAQPLYVQVDFGGQATVPNTSAYAMIGVNTTGALALQPEIDQGVGPGTLKFGLTPFSFSPQNTNIHGSKIILLPAGTTTITMQARRSATGNTPNMDYTVMIITPLNWVGAPGGFVNQTRGTTAQRDAIYGVPGTDAEKSSLANRVIEWFNIDKGYTEIYYATTGTAGLAARGLVAGNASGWYPEAGSLLTCTRLKNNGFQATVAGTLHAPTLLSPAINVGAFTSSGDNVIVVPIGGYYRITASAYFSGGGPMSYRSCIVRYTGGAEIVSGRIPGQGADGVAVAAVEATLVPGGQGVEIVVQTAIADNVYGDGVTRKTYLAVTYAAPPLVNG